MIMAPSANFDIEEPAAQYPTIVKLRKVLTSETSPLAHRFRALFSLKHLASQPTSSPQTLLAIQVIAAAFTSSSALLKHELAYCLGQTRNLAAVPFLRAVLENKNEDSMCRHEAAEALGALGDVGSLDMLKQLRDSREEIDVVRETCEIAVARIEWENSEERRAEKLRPRYTLPRKTMVETNGAVIFLLLIPPHRCPRTLNNPQLVNSKSHCSTERIPCFFAIELCLLFAILHLLLTFPQQYLPYMLSLEAFRIRLRYSDMKSLSSSGNLHTLLQSLRWLPH
jgi:hypothetical protein